MDLLTQIREDQIENTLDAPVRTPEEVLASVPDEVDGGMVFETSGRSGSPKRIPCRNLEHVLGLAEDALRLAGFGGDVALNLGAPLPHPTGWGLREVMPRLGGRAVNEHFNDYQTVIEDGSPSEVTALFGVPNVARAIGEAIAETYGPPAEIFPNLEAIGVAGDILTTDRRETLHELWGATTVREMYGAAEFIAVAGSVDDTRRLVPFLHKLVLEIIPDDDPDRIVDVRDVTEERRGSLLITDPARDEVDFTRYRIGDTVSVHPTGDLPRITVLGREDDCISLSGALLYPSQIHETVRDAFGADTDWVAKVSERDYPSVDFYIVNGDRRDDDFLETLLERNGPVREAYTDVSVIESLDVHHVSGRDAVPGVSVEGGMKAQHVVFDDSYTEKYDR